jgi:hypothetical protein
MGLFDIFKKKELTETLNKNEIKQLPSLSNFKFYYLYGFTDNPNKTSNDSHNFNELYSLVIGQVGGVAITNSYHPYFIVNTKGTTTWAAAYVKLYVNDNKDEIFANIINENAIYMVDTSSVFTEMNVWPDTRLTDDENPIFSKHVPFIIPFLVSNTDKELNWDKEINSGIAAKGHASNYVKKVTTAIKFFMPEPTFIIGFDQFDQNNISGLIDKFINCKPMFAGQ